MIIKSVSPIIQDLDAQSFTVLGCTGADGLGAAAMQYFYAGLTGAQGDFIAILGDVSPLGRDPYYHQVNGFIESVSSKPVHVLRGNHDGPDYESYFGHANRAILSEVFTLIMLDNSARTFSDETLSFLRETMALVQTRNVIVAFHVPPPNRFSGHSLSEEEWQRFEDAVGVWRNRISLLVASHSHSYFEDEVGGLRLVVTGGGGAEMNELDRVKRPSHHALEISFDADYSPVVEFRRLARSNGSERSDVAVRSLFDLYMMHCRQRVELVLNAEDAEEAGAFNLARMYRAGAQSCLHQARILHRLLRTGNMGLRGAASNLLRVMIERVRERDSASADRFSMDILARLAVDGADVSEKRFLSFLDRALTQMSSGTDISLTKYYLCESCGSMTAGTDAPTYCAQCGAPGYFVEEA